MLYDLGKSEHQKMAYAAVGLMVAAGIATACFVCIVLALAVRIGNLIIGW
jgi:hypothetical protein